MHPLRNTTRSRQTILFLSAGLVALIQAQAALTTTEAIGPPTNRFGSMPRPKV